MSIRTKLVIGGAAIASVTCYMAYLGAATSWQYYPTVDECAPAASTLVGQRVRVSGRIAARSLRIRKDRTQATFVLQGLEARLGVECPGPLPDNLAEDMDAVVEGALERGDFIRARKVLTRCASKYEPGRPAPSGKAVSGAKGRS